MKERTYLYQLVSADGLTSEIKRANIASVEIITPLSFKLEVFEGLASEPRSDRVRRYEHAYSESVQFVVFRERGK